MIMEKRPDSVLSGLRVFRRQWLFLNLIELLNHLEMPFHHRDSLFDECLEVSVRDFLIGTFEERDILLVRLDHSVHIDLSKAAPDRADILAIIA
jgi:hypothetical protein